MKILVAEDISEKALEVLRTENGWAVRSLPKLKGASVEQVAGFGRGGSVQAHDVARLQQFFQPRQPHILLARDERADVRVVGEHLHFEALGEARDFRADLAEADEAQRFAAQLEALKLRDHLQQAVTPLTLMAR